MRRYSCSLLYYNNLDNIEISPILNCDRNLSPIIPLCNFSPSNTICWKFASWKWFHFGHPTSPSSTLSNKIPLHYKLVKPGLPFTMSFSFRSATPKTKSTRIIKFTTLGIFMYRIVYETKVSLCGVNNRQRGNRIKRSIKFHSSSLEKAINEMNHQWPVTPSGG